MQTETKEINLRIAAIDIASISIHDKPENFDASRVQFEIKAEHNLEIAQNVVNINLYIILFLPHTERQELAKFKVLYSFHIANLNELVLIEGNVLKLPVALLQVLHMLSISTTRGVMLVELKGTHLEKAYLPIIDPGKMTLVDEQGNVV